MLSSTIHYLLAFSSKNKDLQNSLKNLLGFYPSNISLYKLAFSHRSVSVSAKNGMSSSNERLEYLGDAFIAVEFESSAKSDHSVLTEQVQESGVQRVIEFLQQKLKPNHS